MLRGQRECEPPTSREEPFPWLPTPGPPKGEGGQSWPLLSYVVTDSEALKLVSQKRLKKLTSAPSPSGPVPAPVHPSSVTEAEKRCVCEGMRHHVRRPGGKGPCTWPKQAPQKAPSPSARPCRRPAASAPSRGTDARAGDQGPGQAGLRPRLHPARV